MPTDNIRNRGRQAYVDPFGFHDDANLIFGGEHEGVRSQAPSYAGDEDAENRDYWLRQAYRVGRGGMQSFNVPNFGSSEAFINLQVPEWMSQQWTVTLMGFRWGGAGAAGLSAGQPPENQTDATPGYQAVVQYGTAGAFETALIDWYARGCTFQVTSAFLRVLCQRQFAFSASPILPVLGGFAIPNQRTGSLSPTFTTAFQLLPFGTSATYPIPRRAIGYRPFILQNTATNTYGLLECSFTQNNIGTVVNVDTATTATGGLDQQPSNRSSWVPINPLASFVVATNNAPAISHNIGIQFLLDLG